MRSRRLEQFIEESRRFARELVNALGGGNAKRATFRLSLLAIIIIAMAITFAWTGLFPLSASSGHAPITYWFLDFGKRNVVGTLSTGIDVPPLDDPALVMKGAGHYATACAPCHGAPGKQPFIKGMTPRPPNLQEKADRWKDEELFWIVKHGIKFTGMPAWQAQDRDDEIWAMVDFLKTLPALDANAYEHLAYGDIAKLASNDNSHAEDLDGVLENCVRCHGADGSGRGNGAFPRLTQQNEAYLFESLRAYADGTRPSGIMQAAVANLEPGTLRALAKYFSAVVPQVYARPAEREPELFSAGQTIALQGAPARGVPACRHCHASDPRTRNARFPVLHGQYDRYLESQLELFRAGTRAGTSYATIMNIVADGMSDADIRAVAHYYSKLDERDTREEPPFDDNSK